MLRNLPKSIASIASVLALVLAMTVAVDVSKPQEAEAFTTSGSPTIGCLAGVLELQGRMLFPTGYNDTVWSQWDLYEWNGGWDLVERTSWQRFDLTPQSFAANDTSGIKPSGKYYAAIERLAFLDGGEWAYDTALTQLKPSYAAMGSAFGSGYYARCT